MICRCERGKWPIGQHGKASAGLCFTGSGVRAIRLEVFGARDFGGKKARS
jgi:hypothetical protein